MKTTNETKKSYIIDMDGVLVSGRTVIPGAPEFIQRLRASTSEIEFAIT